MEFYLIDFKKGVEFKAYATHQLPHARVIAIESEREFGLSVLERLDEELKRRGDLFRKQGVQDLKGYRDAEPDGGDAADPADHRRVPGVLRRGRQASRRTRRCCSTASCGRAGRSASTCCSARRRWAGRIRWPAARIGQMAVRIALQCSEADAHLILSEDNTAARLLSRPGEAIYNDANGLFEGNHPFQVVWLSDEQRESYLQRDRRHWPTSAACVVPPPIVFEGNAAADPADNTAARRRCCNRLRPQHAPLAPRAWLGAAVAIKDPTDAVFRRQSGSNLLIVGQQEELALGMLADGADRARRDSSPAGAASPSRIDDVSRLRDSTSSTARAPMRPKPASGGRLAAQLPLDAQVVPPRDAARSDRASLPRKSSAAWPPASKPAEPIFLVIYNLARFRDLKKADDFSFDDDDGAGAGKQLATILREGPALGVHTLVWCDSYNNVNRWLDRQTLRDFELRVLFQMSADRFEQPDGQPRRQQARRPHGAVLQRRARPGRKVPPLRPAAGRVARLGRGSVWRPAAQRTKLLPRRQFQPPAGLLRLQLGDQELPGSSRTSRPCGRIRETTFDAGRLAAFPPASRRTWPSAWGRFPSGRSPAASSGWDSPGRSADRPS